MRRWFLSYNSQDLGFMQSLEEALQLKDPDAKIFFAPKSLRAAIMRTTTGRPTIPPHGPVAIASSVSSVSVPG